MQMVAEKEKEQVQEIGPPNGPPTTPSAIRSAIAGGLSIDRLSETKQSHTNHHRCLGQKQSIDYN